MSRDSARKFLGEEWWMRLPGGQFRDFKESVGGFKPVTRGGCILAVTPGSITPSRDFAFPSSVLEISRPTVSFFFWREVSRSIVSPFASFGSCKKGIKIPVSIRFDHDLLFFLVTRTPFPLLLSVPFDQIVFR